MIYSIQRRSFNVYAGVYQSKRNFIYLFDKCNMSFIEGRYLVHSLEHSGVWKASGTNANDTQQYLFPGVEGVLCFCLMRCFLRDNM